MTTPSIFTEDSGGNSTLTRLDAELKCMMRMGDHEQVTDSSLTYGDLRLLRQFVSRNSVVGSDGRAYAMDDPRIPG